MQFPTVSYLKFSSLSLTFISLNGRHLPKTQFSVVDLLLSDIFATVAKRIALFKILLKTHGQEYNYQKVDLWTFTVLRNGYKLEEHVRQHSFPFYFSRLFCCSVWADKKQQLKGNEICKSFNNINIYNATYKFNLS